MRDATDSRDGAPSAASPHTHAARMPSDIGAKCIEERDSALTVATLTGSVAWIGHFAYTNKHTLTLVQQAGLCSLVYIYNNMLIAWYSNENKQRQTTTKREPWKKQTHANRPNEYRNDIYVLIFCPQNPISENVLQIGQCERRCIYTTIYSV